jgi:hypothetical protein
MKIRFTLNIAYAKASVLCARFERRRRDKNGTLVGVPDKKWFWSAEKKGTPVGMPLKNGYGLFIY